MLTYHCPISKPQAFHVKHTPHSLPTLHPPIAFHSQSLHSTEWNYDTHNKELLAVFVAFERWCNYLEGSTHPVDTVMDHKNLEYFTMTKKLTQCQVRWSEFLSQFNLKIWFRPGWLGAKPDSLTCQWDVYGDRMIECNIQPIFFNQQVSSSTASTKLWSQSQIHLPPAYFGSWTAPTTWKDGSW